MADHSWTWLMALGLVGLVLGAIDPRLDLEVETATAAGVIDATGFTQDGVDPATPAPGGTLAAVPRFGSMSSLAAAKGRLEIGPLRIDSETFVLVSGYPNAPGMRLIARVRGAEGPGVEWPVEVDTALAGGWQRVLLVPPSAPAAEGREVTLVAEDASTEPSGWLGLSLPFRVTAASHALQTLVDLVQLAGAFVATLAALLGPGLVLSVRLRGASRRLVRMALPLPGLLLLSAGGGLLWLMGGSALEPAAAFGFLALLLGGCAVALWSSVPRNGHALRVVLLAALLGGGAALARTAIAAGPRAELYAGTVSRTFAIGDRSDSRISYHLVQAIGLGWGVKSSSLAALYSPWSFRSRGPLPGLAAAPFVLASWPSLPRSFPESPWRLRDGAGFGVYRTAMIALAASMLFVLHALARRGMRARDALLCVVLLPATPFLFHETFFTWPKLAAGTLAAWAAVLGLERRIYASAAVTILGFLLHPLALLSFSTAGVCYAWASWRALAPPRPRQELATIAKRGLAAAALVGASFGLWSLLPRAAGSPSFFSYVAWADGFRHAGFEAWIASRAHSLVNTLVPFALPLLDGDHGAVNPVNGHAATLGERYPFLAWCTLPFGVGLCALPSFLVGLIHATRDSLAAVLLLVVVPFVVFLLYWGAATTGLMREGLHAVFLCALLLAARGGMCRALVARPAPLVIARVIEPALIAIVPATAAVVGTRRGYTLGSDAVAALVMVAALGGLAVVARALGARRPR